MGVVLADIMNAYFGRELKKDYYFAGLAQLEQQKKQGLIEKDRLYFKEQYGDENWCNIPEPDYQSTNINQAGRMRRLAFTAEEVKEAEEYWGVSHSVMAISAGLLALSRFTGNWRTDSVITAWSRWSSDIKREKSSISING